VGSSLKRHGGGSRLFVVSRNWRKRSAGREIIRRQRGNVGGSSTASERDLKGNRVLLYKKRGQA